jgi:lipid A 3-O-deacylase
MIFSRAVVFLSMVSAGLGLVSLGRAAEVLSTADLPQSRLQFGSVRFYSENDKYFAGTDQHYTNGFKLSFLSTDLTTFTSDPVPLLVQRVARTLSGLVPPGQDCKLGLSLGQNIYTPVNTSLTTPQPNDRPYAAWLYGGVAFQVYAPARAFATGLRAPAWLDTFELTFGMIGPAALGREVQNNFHHLIDAVPANGWDNQISNEPGLNLVYDRTVRFATRGARSGWGADILPHGGISLGNIFTNVSLGVEGRFGWKLPADFGTNLIRPTGDSNSRRRPDVSIFGFAAWEGRAVIRDATLQGNTFHDSASVKPERLVEDLLGGIAFGTRRWQLTYSEAVRSREFEGQQKAAVFGSISATFYY